MSKPGFSSNKIVLLIGLLFLMCLGFSGCKGSSSGDASGSNEPPATLNAPSGLSASAVSSSRIDLSWSDNSSGETGFIVERAMGGPFNEVATLGANTTTYSDTSLNAGTLYTYRVCAYNHNGNSAYSSSAAATTLALASPETPQNLLASAVSSYQINLSWTDTTNEDGYSIERSDDGAAYAWIAETEADITDYRDASIDPGKNYSYRLASFNEGGPSGYSNTAGAVTPPKPDNDASRAEVLALVTGQTYYLEAAGGNDDTGDGSAASPWKTLDKARSMVTGGDCVMMRDGHYGAYDGTPVERDAWVVYMNDAGHSPVITHIVSRNTIAPYTNVYLVFYGITITPSWVDPAGDEAWQATHPGSTDPQYPQSQTGTYAKASPPVDAYGSNYLRFINCEITGTNKHLTIYGLNINYCNDVLVRRCHIRSVSRGVLFRNGARISVLDNQIHDTTSTFIQSGVYCSEVLIQGNHAYDCNWSPEDDWCPRAPGHTYHASFISIRSSDVAIRGNIFHDGGTSSTFMLYDDPGCPAAYQNIIIENNLLYDPQTQSGLRLVRPGDNIVVRNNILVGRARDVQAGPQQYGTVFNLSNVPDGYDGSGLSLYNNIFIGMAGFGTWFGNIDEGSNIYWSALTTPGGVWTFLTQADLVNGSKVITSANGTLSDYFTSGFFNGTLDFSWTEEPPTCHGHGRIMDYTYAAGSEAINFGDSANQPSDSLGTLDASGFILDDGPTRDASRHSAGCYEL